MELIPGTVSRSASTMHFLILARRQLEDELIFFSFDMFSSKIKTPEQIERMRETCRVSVQLYYV